MGTQELTAPGTSASYTSAALTAEIADLRKKVLCLVCDREDLIGFLNGVMADHRAQLPSETKDLYGGGCGCPQCENGRLILRRLAERQ